MAICLKIELQTKQVSPKHKYVCTNGKAGRYFCPFIIQPMSTYSILNKWDKFLKKLWCCVSWGV